MKKKKTSSPTHDHGQHRQRAQKQQVAQVNDELGSHDQNAQRQHDADPVEQVTVLSPFPMLPGLAVHGEQTSIIIPSSWPSPNPVQDTRDRRRKELLPENIVRHVMDVYLVTFNSVLVTVLSAVSSPNRGRLAVNVAECLDNAQSILNDTVSGDMTLQSVQIFLGLGTLFMEARPGDVRAPIIFVSTAMRLTQAMGMHRKDSYKNTQSVEDMQRRRVFWIAYILDRDVAARTRQGPMQHDADMDLDLPLIEDEVAMAVTGNVADAGADNDYDDADDGACARGMTKLNLFRARVQLARIQGRVYNCVFSVRARHMDPGEKARLAQGIRLSIQQWKARLPTALGVDFLSSQNDNHGSTDAAILPAVMCYMHSLTTMCLGQLCCVNSMDFHWIEEVLSYARGLGDCNATSSFTSPSSVITPPSPSAEGWNVLVSQCHEFMRAFLSIRSKHPTSVNVQLCPFMSILLCPSVNLFLNFEDGNRLTDQRLMAGAATVLGGVMEQTQ
ncbi:unnamed protein product [Colletotrichum noveboracense]|uniref:Xylanolytic transcriptional activator regulatory domain-containing protein n=1 Tax=Colletotrichum noveboracense TaxID=2664923 RepID=A0A9W4W9V4_9PEZI|nr:unnamed protein product [Colletotrichum noveboracense]